MLDVIQKKKISDQVCKYIRDLIIKNELKSGERIVETKIAKQLGISQAPVREAIRELEAMGLVVTKPYSGCFVKPITEKELCDTYRIRALLESFAVTQAMERIGQTELDALKEKIQEMRYAAQIDDTDLHIEADVAFHEIIIRATHNPLLEKMWQMASVAQWTCFTIEYSDESLAFFEALHQPIYDFIEAGNREGAAREIEKHFIMCEDLVKRKFSEGND